VEVITVDRVGSFGLPDGVRSAPNNVVAKAVLNKRAIMVFICDGFPIPGSNRLGFWLSTKIRQPTAYTRVLGVGFGPDWSL